MLRKRSISEKGDQRFLGGHKETLRGEGEGEMYVLLDRAGGFILLM